MENYCIIMAGGVGSRFWPMSKTSNPKQFLDILGTGETLIQQTFRRFKKTCKPENIWVVTNDKYKDLVLEQIPEMSENQILCEPCMRNTAPCIAYACYKIAAQTSKANIIVSPADHLILKEDEFNIAINTALEHTASNKNIITLGIAPTRPDTGYGYIERDLNDESEGRVKKVKQFREKPDHETAMEFLIAGNFSWNSGMFIWSLDTILEAFETNCKDIASLFKTGIKKYNTPEEREFINQIYPECPNISVDYAILEKAENVYVIKADIGWSDLGTWGSVYNHLEHDEKGNAVVGNKVLLPDSANCIVNVPKDKIVVAQGLKNYIIVESDNTLIIINKHDEQRIKEFRALVGDTYGKEHI